MRTTKYQITENERMKNIYNKKTVQGTEWIKSDTVVVRYTDGSKETMSRKSFNQIIKD